jgi:hypothetical protein
LSQGKVRENEKRLGRGITKTSLTFQGTKGYNEPLAESGVVEIQLCLVLSPFYLNACTGITLLRAMTWLIRLLSLGKYGSVSGQFIRDLYNTR